MKYKSQIIEGFRGNTPNDSVGQIEPHLQKALDDGVAKGWKLFSVAAAASGGNDRSGGGVYDGGLGGATQQRSNEAAQSGQWKDQWKESMTTVGAHYMITLIWEVPSPKPMTPQEVERERRREVERERKRGGRTTAG